MLRECEAAGELATEWGITGWQQGEAMQAAIACFKVWLDSFGGEGNQEERAMIAQVRHSLESNGEVRFSDMGRPIVDDNHVPRTMSKLGFRRKNDEGHFEYYCYKGAFEDEICKGYDSIQVARLLIDKGYMRHGDGNHLCPKVTLPGEKAKRVYHILPTLWDDKND